MQLNAIRASGVGTETFNQLSSGSSARPVTAGGEALPVRAREAVSEQERQSSDAFTQAVREINEAVKSIGSGLRFQVDEESKQVIIKIVDESTGEVLKQIPPEVSLRLAQALGKVAGLLVDKHV